MQRSEWRRGTKPVKKTIYGCERDPMPAIGIGTLKGDNGSGIRNSVVKSAAIGSAIQTIDARTYRGGDKPHIERMFGTMESGLIYLLHGYTGRRANALPGYDAIKNGVLDTEELYGLITRYLVDEYPLERHSGTGMYGRPPIVVAKGIGGQTWYGLPSGCPRSPYSPWLAENMPDYKDGREIPRPSL